MGQKKLYLQGILLRYMKLRWIVAIALCCIAIFYLFETYFRNRAYDQLANSSGIFDEHAQSALDNFERLQCPTAKDRFNLARIVDLNGHDGRINNVRVLNDVVGHYMYNLKPNRGDSDGTLDDLDWFELDQIENFVKRHEDIMYANPQHNEFIDTVLQARPKKIVHTLHNARETSDSKKEAFQSFVDDNVVYTSDVQNVHDSAVNEQLRNAWKKIKERTPPTLDNRSVFVQIENYIKHSQDPESIDNKKRALKALSEIRKQRYNSTLGTTEDDILVTVWNRADMQANQGMNKTLIRDAMVDALVDMSPDGETVVCSNGRCARMIESLVHTDAVEDIVDGVLTVEQIRNDVMQKSNDILKETIEEFKIGGDENLRKVARSYEDPTVKSNSKDEKRFKDAVKQRIEKCVLGYADRLSVRDYENIRNHCLMAIDST